MVRSWISWWNNNNEIMLEVVLNNDIRNHCNINGVFTCQHFEIGKAFDKLYDYLKSNKIVIDNIIEIGTFRGGFTLFR